MFDSPPNRLILQSPPLHAVHSESRELTAEGRRIEDQVKRQAQTEADASERESSPGPPGWSSGTVHQFRSVSSHVAFGQRLVNEARL